MTPRELIVRLNDEIEEELSNVPLQHRDLYELDVPQLMHIKAGLDRALLDAISDDETPCPHTGTRWPVNGAERCGLCSRVLQKEAVNGD